MGIRIDVFEEHTLSLVKQRWTLLADGLIEASLYFAILLTPVMVDVNLQRVFALPKVALIRLFATLIVMGWLYKGLLALQARQGRPPRDLLRHPLAWPILAYGLSFLLSVIVSILPQASIWGGFLRIHGLWTVLSFIILGLALAVHIRRRAQLEQCIDLILLASWPVVLYGLAQAFNLDPLSWQNYTGRILSTLGNPVFMGAYIALIAPLTLYRWYTLWQAYRRQPQRSRLVGLVWVGGLALAQILGLILTQSRGPVLAFLVEIFFLVVLLTRRRAVVMALFGVVALGGVALLAINIPGSPLEQVRAIRGLGRLANLRDDYYRSTIWSHVVTLLGSNSTRLVIGYGPEALDVALIPHSSLELAYLGGQSQQIDRSHNVLFEALASSGVLGLVSEVWLFLAVLAFGLTQIGLLHTRWRQALVYVLPLLGGVLFAIGTRLALRAWTWAGLLAGLGMVAGLGLAVWVLRSRPSTPAKDPAPPPDVVLLTICLLVGWLGHFVESLFSPEAETVLLYAWLWVGLLIALHRPEKQTDMSADDSAATQRPAASVAVAGFSATALANGLYLGLPVVLLTIGLIDWTPPFNLDSHVYLVLALAGLTWLLALGWLVWRGQTLASGDEPVVNPELWPSAYLSLSIVLSGLTVYIISQFVSLTVLPLIIIYGMVIAATVGLACILQPALTTITGRSSDAVPLAVLSLMAVAVVALVTVLPHIGDRYFSLGRRLVGQGQQLRGLDALTKARQAAPDQDVYFLVSSDIVANIAANMNDPTQQGATFERSRGLAAQAARLKPQQPYHAANLAHIELRWAESTTNTQLRNAAIQRGLDIMGQIGPTLDFDPAIYDDWGYLYYLQRDYAKAIAKYDHALKLVPGRAQTYILKGRALHDVGDFNAAEWSYRAAIDFERTRLDAYSELTQLFLEQGRPQDALPFAEEAVKQATNRYYLYHNLALVYARLGRTGEAMEQLKVAIRYAPPAEEPKLRAMMQQLTGQ